MRDLGNQFLRFVCANVKKSTAASYRLDMKYLMQFIGDKDPAKVTIADVQQLLMYCQKERGVRNCTLKTKVALAKRFFQWLEDTDVIQKQPAWRLLPKIRSKSDTKIPISYEQHLKLLEYLPKLGAMRNYRGWMHSILITAWHTGLRLSDCCLIKRAEIDFENEVASVHTLKKEAFEEVLHIPLDNELMEHIIHFRDNEWPKSPYSEFVFPTAAGYYDGYKDAARRQITQLFNIAGLNHLTFHCYRHAFVTRLINSGTDPIIISSMTGQSPEMIAHYAHISTPAKVAAIERGRKALHQIRNADIFQTQN